MPIFIDDVALRIILCNDFYRISHEISKISSSLMRIYKYCQLRQLALSISNECLSREIEALIYLCRAVLNECRLMKIS